MKILLLSRYSRQGASSRLRTMQYLPYLAEAGIDVEVAPFFDDDYVRAFNAGQSAGIGIAKYFVRRLARLFPRPKVELLWIEYEALPWLPWAVERLALPSAIPIVTDYDDAVFHRYDMNRKFVVRATLGKKIDRIMAASTSVFAGNTYLAERATNAGASQVKIVPTVIDMERYSTDHLSPPDGWPRIGWIGSPSTWEQYISPMLPMLSSVASEHDALIRAVGATAGATSTPWLEIMPWSEGTEVSLIQSMDIGIMPLDDSPWSRGKCGYKLIQYMACGLPVVASPVGVNSQIVEHGVNGFLASSDREWREALETLLKNPDLRRRMGEAGRRKVEREYSIQIYGPKVAKIFYDLITESWRS